MTTVETRAITSCDLCGASDFRAVGRSPDFEYETCDNEFDFVECTHCGHAYLKDRPVEDELGVIYPPEYIPHRFDEHLGPLITRLRNFVQKKKVAPLVPYLEQRATVVDVGPGNGELLAILSRFGSPQWDLWAIDFSADVIKMIEDRGFKGICSRFETVEWQGPAPDAIVMNQLIEHLASPREAVAKACSMLAPGGVLFIETPSIDAWDYRLFKARHWGGWHTPRHWHLFKPETLSQLVEREGFSVVEVKHILSPNFWLQSVHHYLHDRRKMVRFADLFDVSVLPSLALASALDVVQLGLRRKTSNFRLVARKPA